MPIYSPNVTPAVTAAILRRRQISGFILSAISFFMIPSITYTIMYRKHIIALSSIPVFRQKNTRHYGRAISYLVANIGHPLPRRIAIYSDRCALFRALHFRAFSLYLALLFFRQVELYSFAELGGCLLMPSPLFFELRIMFALVAWVFVFVHVDVLANLAGLARFEMIFGRPPLFF